MSPADAPGLSGIPLWQRFRGVRQFGCSRIVTVTVLVLGVILMFQTLLFPDSAWVSRMLPPSTWIARPMAIRFGVMSWLKCSSMVKGCPSWLSGTSWKLAVNVFPGSGVDVGATVGAGVAVGAGVDVAAGVALESPPVGVDVAPGSDGAGVAVAIDGGVITLVSPIPEKVVTLTTVCTTSPS